ncbi:hypothetical protein, partial [Methanomethylophilus alvi]|uniref:hypothetical protein n=1 Tax=Methanomethylophilus alvi TaxID=1291540 RepID=UPI0037DD49CB
VSSTGDYVGGIVGYINDASRTSGYGSVNLTADINNANVTGNTYVGGLIGYGKDANCTYLTCSGTISGKSNVGAIGTTSGDMNNNTISEAHIIIK